MRDRRIAGVYESLAPLDFLRDILQRDSSRLGVIAVPRCGWSDLGTPRRVADVLERKELSRVR